jgi:membrane protease YdiL (CAAX protease family)
MANNNKKRGASQLLDFARDSYPDRTSRPIYALTYLIGFIVLYEIGTFLISTDVLSNSIQVRVVSFAWIQNMLTNYLNFPAKMTWIATPLVVLVILLALQITSKTPWKVTVSDFLPMTIECIIFAVPLIVLSLTINSSVSTQMVTVNAADAINSGSGISNLAVQLVSGIGAGIYEELVFRLILISFLMLIFQDFLGVTRRNSIILSVLISAVLFSAHHHLFFINGSLTRGEAFVFSVFVFRILAGIYFAAIFAIRGFAIAVGTHAFYDILAALLNFWLFSGPPAGSEVG